MTQPKLLDRVRSVARLRHLSLSTGRTYADWIKRYILYHGKRHPSEMGVGEIRQFLSHSAVTKRVSASTQNQALCALLFLYRDVLQADLTYVDGIERAKRPARVPVVFTREEVGRLLAHLSGTSRLIASLLYGLGLRLMEGLRLRVKDVDFDYCQITIREGKGEKDRRTVLPRPLEGPLRQQLAQVKLLHEQDMSEGYGAVYLPYALERKYPRAVREWGDNTSLLRLPAPQTRAPAQSAANTPRPTASSTPSGGWCGWRASPSTAAATRCGTASPRTCSKTATICGQFKSYWGTQTCGRRRFTRTC